MENKGFFKAVLVIMLVSTMALIGCGDGSDDGNGNGNGKDALDGTTWSGVDKYNVQCVFKFNSPNWTMSRDGQTQNGKYTISGNVVTLNSSNGAILHGTISGNTINFSAEGGPILTKQ